MSWFKNWWNLVCYEIPLAGKDLGVTPMNSIAFRIRNRTLVFNPEIVRFLSGTIEIVQWNYIIIRYYINFSSTISFEQNLYSSRSHRARIVELSPPYPQRLSLKSYHNEHSFERESNLFNDTLNLFSASKIKLAIVRNPCQYTS